jgi:hypothetical protein
MFIVTLEDRLHSGWITFWQTGEDAMNETGDNNQLTNFKKLMFPWQSGSSAATQETPSLPFYSTGRFISVLKLTSPHSAKIYNKTTFRYFTYPRSL